MSSKLGIEPINNFIVDQLRLEGYSRKHVLLNEWVMSIANDFSLWTHEFDPEIRESKSMSINQNVWNESV